MSSNKLINRIKFEIRENPKSKISGGERGGEGRKVEERKVGKRKNPKALSLSEVLAGGSGVDFPETDNSLSGGVSIKDLLENTLKGGDLGEESSEENSEEDFGEENSEENSEENESESESEENSESYMESEEYAEFTNWGKGVEKEKEGKGKGAKGPKGNSKGTKTPELESLKKELKESSKSTYLFTGGNRMPVKRCTVVNGFPYILKSRPEETREGEDKKREEKD